MNSEIPTPEDIYRKSNETYQKECNNIVANVSNDIFQHLKGLTTFNGKTKVKVGAYVVIGKYKTALDFVKSKFAAIGWDIKFKRGWSTTRYNDGKFHDMIAIVTEKQTAPTYSLPKKRFFNLGRIFMWTTSGIFGYYFPHICHFIYTYVLMYASHR